MTVFPPQTSEELLLVLERNGWNTAPFRRALAAEQLLLGRTDGDGAVDTPRGNSGSCGGGVAGAGASAGEAHGQQPLAAGGLQPPRRPRVSEVVAVEAVKAYGRIRQYVRCTPLEPSPWLEGLSRDAAAAAAAAAPAAVPGTVADAVSAGELGTTGADEISGGVAASNGGCGCGSVALKLESEQHSGSFKARGAVNKLLSLPELQPSTHCAASPAAAAPVTVFTASTGNHALAVLYACSALRQQQEQEQQQQGQEREQEREQGQEQGQQQERPHGQGRGQGQGQVPGGEGAAACAGAAAASVGLAGGGKLGNVANEEEAEEQGEEEEEAASGSAPLVTPVLYVPTTASPYKVRKLRSLGARLVLHGSDCLEAEKAARAAAEAAAAAAAAAVGSGGTGGGGGGGVYVSPYNDVWVMAGQGTLALELLAARRRGRLDAVLVPVGGGGLVAGVAAVLKAADPNIWVVGCQPAASDVMARSVRVGTVQPEAAPPPPTLSDATAGGVEEDSLTLQPCVDCVDEWVCVDEHEIAAGLVGLLREQSKLVEGAAAVALAAYRRLAAALAGRHVVVVCCGGNIALDALRGALDMAAAAAVAASGEIQHGSGTHGSGPGRLGPSSKVAGTE